MYYFYCPINFAETSIFEDSLIPFQPARALREGGGYRLSIHFRGSLGRSIGTDWRKGTSWNVVASFVKTDRMLVFPAILTSDASSEPTQRFTKPRIQVNLVLASVVGFSII